MKIIRVDNYDRELFDDELIKEHVGKEEGLLEVEELNNNSPMHGPYFYRLVEDNHKLFERDY